MYKYIFFDLDGTLTDSGIGITNSVMFALKKWNIEVKDRGELFKFIGPPLNESFERFYGFKDEELKLAYDEYHKYFDEKGIYENLLYDEIEYTLKELKKQNKVLVVATSKPEHLAKRVIEHFKLEHYFEYVIGSNTLENRNSKTDVIEYALSKFKDINLKEVIMVGDRDYDIKGAKNNNIDSVGVLYGYGNKKEFEDAKANFIIKKPLELLEIVKE